MRCINFEMDAWLFDLNERLLLYEIEGRRSDQITAMHAKFSNLAPLINLFIFRLFYLLHNYRLRINNEKKKEKKMFCSITNEIYGIEEHKGIK